MRTVLTLLLLLSASFSSSVLANQGRAMYAAYQNINYSLRGATLLFTCEQGLTEFRLRSEFGTRAKLYWRSNNKRWVELKDVIYGDSYISFEGMGKEGGVDVRDINLNVGLPIFNDTESKTANDYFYKAKRSGFTDYVYVVDMVNQQMQASNVEPIVDHLVLDKAKYFREQAYKSTGYVIAIEKTQRENILKEAAARYADGVRVVTPHGKHQLISQCYML